MHMSVSTGGLNIRFLDSLNFLSMPLAQLPKSFGLEELEKGFFPHFFNTKENQDDILLNLLVFCTSSGPLRLYILFAMTNTYPDAMTPI